MSQAEVDRWFGVTDEDRAALRAGRLGKVGRHLSWPIWPRAVALGTALGGLAYIVTNQLVAAPLGAEHLLGLVVLATVAFAARRWLADWLHARRVLAARPALRAVEGPATTVRTWSYVKGDAYVLSAALRFEGETLPLPDVLGEWTITGWARAFVQTVPTRLRGLAPFYEQVLAIDVRPDTDVTPRSPRPAPEEPYRVDVPAD